MKDTKNVNQEQEAAEEAEVVEETEAAEEETTEETVSTEEGDNNEVEDTEAAEEDTTEEESADIPEWYEELGYDSAEAVRNALNSLQSVEEEEQTLESRIATLEQELADRDAQIKRQNREREIEGAIKDRGISTDSLSKVIALSQVYSLDLFDDSTDLDEAIATIVSDNQALIGGGTRSNDEGNPTPPTIDLKKAKEEARKMWSW